MYTRAIVRTPGKNLEEGLSTSNLGKPDYERAFFQHEEYVAALERCGLDVMVLPPEDKFPDATFVEDAALIAGQLAIITRPGAPSRRGEITVIRPVIEQTFTKIKEVQAPGTIEGGDILKVESHFYVGLSDRTNSEGAQQVITMLENEGFSGSTVKLEKMLHLKTGLAYLENNILVAAGEMTEKKQFQSYNMIKVDPKENYAANCIWVNSTVLLPKDHPKTKHQVEKAGYSVVELDVSEFQKMDAGLSCLSLRF